MSALSLGCAVCVVTTFVINRVNFESDESNESLPPSGHLFILIRLKYLQCVKIGTYKRYRILSIGNVVMICINFNTYFIIVIVFSTYIKLSPNIFGRLVDELSAIKQFWRKQSRWNFLGAESFMRVALH
jgi:hypothetical protein